MTLESKHEIDNPQCPICPPSFPRLCFCEGYIHAEYEKHGEHIVIMVEECDWCGFDLVPVEELGWI